MIKEKLSDKEYKNFVISGTILMLSVFLIIINAFIQETHAYYKKTDSIQIFNSKIADFRSPALTKFYVNEEKEEKYTNQQENTAYFEWEEDSEIEQVCVTEKSKEECEWVDASKSTKFKLENTEDGEKTLRGYVKKKNGQISGGIEDKIIYDGTKPVCGKVNKTATGTSGVSGNVECSDELSGCSQASFEFTYLKSTSDVYIYDIAGNSNNCSVPVSHYTTEGYYTKRVCSCSKYNTDSGSVCGACLNTSCTGYSCPSGYTLYDTECRTTGGGLYVYPQEPGFSCSKACGNRGLTPHESSTGCHCYNSLPATCDGTTCLSWPTCEDSSFGCKTWSYSCDVTYPSYCSESETNTTKTTCSYYPGSTTYS